METSMRLDMEREFRPPPRRPGLQAERGRQALDHGDIRSVWGRAADARADNRSSRSDPAQEAFRLLDAQAFRLRHERDGRLGLENVEVEGDVDTVDPFERRFGRVGDPPLPDAGLLRRIEVARPDEGNVVRAP